MPHCKVQNYLPPGTSPPVTDEAGESVAEEHLQTQSMAHKFVCFNDHAAIMRSSYIHVPTIYLQLYLFPILCRFFRSNLQYNDRVVYGIVLDRVPNLDNTVRGSNLL